MARCGNVIGLSLARVVGGCWLFYLCGMPVEGKRGIVKYHILEHMILNNNRYAFTVILLEDSLCLFIVSS